jgi:hypothetical protein
VEDVSVAVASCGWEGCVVLHADVGNVAGVSGEGTEEAGEGGEEG